MEILQDQYEQLGKFYLGRTYDRLGEKALGDELVIYDSKDLVTHGVVLGMTGSGKTGLCIALLEEAAMDNIPAIIIDPKGDIANLLLTFPDLAPENFRPWINEDDCRQKKDLSGRVRAKTAETWRKGPRRLGAAGERIRQFRDKIDMAVYHAGVECGIACLDPQFPRRPGLRDPRRCRIARRADRVDRFEPAFPRRQQRRSPARSGAHPTLQHFCQHLESRARRHAGSPRAPHPGAHPSTRSG